LILSQKPVIPCRAKKRNFLSFLENLLEGGHGIDGAREPPINRHLEDDLFHLENAAAHVQGAVQMDLELRDGVSQGRQAGDRGDFLGLEMEPCPGVDVAEDILDDEPTEVWGDVPQAGDDALSGLAVDLPELLPAPFVAIARGARFLGAAGGRGGDDRKNDGRLDGPFHLSSHPLESDQSGTAVRRSRTTSQGPVPVLRQILRNANLFGLPSSLSAKP